MSENTRPGPAEDTEAMRAHIERARAALARAEDSVAAIEARNGRPPGVIPEIRREPADIPLRPAPEGYWDVLCEPLGLPEHVLPSWDAAPSGTCGRCHRGPLDQHGLCVYCNLLEYPPDWLRDRPGYLRHVVTRLAEQAQPRTRRSGVCRACGVPAGGVHTRRCQNAAAVRHVVLGVLAMVIWATLLLTMVPHGGHP